MAVVLKWKRDGQYLSRLVSDEDGSEAAWDTKRSKAMRFSSQAQLRRRVSEHFGGWPEWWDGQFSFVRLVSKRRADIPAIHAETHGGVTLTAPATMPLGDVYRTLREFPALRVAFDAEVKRAVDEARETGRAEAKAEIERAQAIPGATARDAVVGMLVRCGWPYLGELFAKKQVDRAFVSRQVADGIAGRISPTDADHACLAAVESLAATDAA